MRGICIEMQKVWCYRKYGHFWYSQYISEKERRILEKKELEDVKNELSEIKKLLSELTKKLNNYN